jgi:hypothetical protein
MALAESVAHKRRQMTVRICTIVLALCLLFLFISKGIAPVMSNQFLGQGIYSDVSLAGQSIFSDRRQRSLGCELDSDLDATLKEYLRPNFAILIGEMHGTEESPQFVQDVACSALRANRRVTIALEIPRQENSRLQDFLEGRQADFFSDSEFWKDEYQDGRRSVAIYQLIERLRGWRKSRYPVRLLAIDDLESHGKERETAMARSLAKDIKENMEDVHIVLTGNIHSQLEKGAPWDSGYVPMGFVLAELVKADSTSIVALDPRYYAGGSAYICQGEDRRSCGVASLTEKSRVEESTATDLARRGVSISETKEPNRFHGHYYFTRPVKSSGPAFATLSLGSR